MKNFRIWFFDQNFERFQEKLKIKAKYLMRNFDEESNLYENDFLKIVLGNKHFYSNFMMFLTNLDQKWIICGKKWNKEI